MATPFAFQLFRMNAAPASREVILLLEPAPCGFGQAAPASKKKAPDNAEAFLVFNVEKISTWQ